MEIKKTLPFVAGFLLVLAVIFVATSVPKWKTAATFEKNAEAFLLQHPAPSEIFSENLNTINFLVAQNFETLINPLETDEGEINYKLNQQYFEDINYNCSAYSGNLRFKCLALKAFGGELAWSEFLYMMNSVDVYEYRTVYNKWLACEMSGEEFENGESPVCVFNTCSEFQQLLDTSPPETFCEQSISAIMQYKCSSSKDALAEFSKEYKGCNNPEPEVE